MPVKTLTHPETGLTVKLGRNRPTGLLPKLLFHDYVNLAAVPSGPINFDYTAKASAALSQMYLNDQLGDCVIAGLAHAVGIETGNATGTPVIFSSAQITSLYSAIGGYVPGDPNTDNGCDEQTALNYVCTTGYGVTGANKPAGWLSVDVTNIVETRTAAWLFDGGLFMGLELPDAYVNPFPSASGFTWDVAGNPDPSNGHCIISGGFVSGFTDKSDGATISTWGMLGTFTYAAMQKYLVPSAGGELYVVISQDSLNKAMQKAPMGLDWTQLTADFKAMGGNIN